MSVPGVRVAGTRLRTNGLARAAVRFRPTAFAGAFVALFFAGAVISACGLMLQTGIVASAPPVRYAAAPVVVAADQTAHVRVGSGEEAETESEPIPGLAQVDLALTPAIAGLAGVTAVVADVTFAVQPADAAIAGRAGGQWQAHGWSSTRLGPAIAAPGPMGRTGAAPADGEVVLTEPTAKAAGLTIGQAVRLTSATGTATYRVRGLLPATAGDAGRPTAYFPDATAPSLAGHPGKADALAVLADPGTPTGRLAARVRDAVRPAGPSTQVLTGDRRSLAEDPLLRDTTELLAGVGGSFGGIATTVAIFVVVSTTALSVSQRRREFALLRAVGATPRQVRRTVATETLLVAAVAAGGGCLPGTLFARWWFDAMTGRGLVSSRLHLVTGWLPYLVTVATVMAAALLAGLVAARRPARIRPAEALQDAAVERARVPVIRLVLGLGTLAGAVAAMTVAAESQGESAADAAAGILMLSLVAVAILGPLVAFLAARLFGAPLRPAGVAGALAAANVRANARRLASVIVPLAMALAFAATLAFLQAGTAHFGARQLADGVKADTVVAGTDGAGLPADTLRSLAAVPGVEAVTGVRHAGVLIATHGSFDSAVAQGLDGEAAAAGRTLDLDVTAGSIADLRPASHGRDGRDGSVGRDGRDGSDGSRDGSDGRDGTVALASTLADSAHARLGQPVTVWLEDGTRIRPRLVAIYRRGLGFGDVTLPAAALDGHTRQPFFDYALARTRPGTEPAALARALRAAGGPAVAVSDPAGLSAAQDKDAEASAWLNMVAAAILAGFAAIAAANTLVMTTLARRREVALLHLVGTTTRQIQRMLRWEALVAGVAACCLGSLLTWATLQPMMRGLAGVATPYIPPGPYLAMIAATLGLAVVATMLPARPVLRGRFAEVAGVRE